LIIVIPRSCHAYDRSVPAPGYPIQLETVTLRAFTTGDFDEFCEYWCLAEVARFVQWRPGDRAEATAGLAKRMASIKVERPGERIMAAIVENATGRLIGEVMLAWNEGANRTGEVGFALHPDVHGRGIALEAARAMLQFGFAEVRLHRVIGCCDARNRPSARVLGKLGLRQEALFRQAEFLKGEWCDEMIFAILADEWRATA
jgi:RimJ/RimL family protein N-acetyltransferase